MLLLLLLVLFSFCFYTLLLFCELPGEHWGDGDQLRYDIFKCRQHMVHMGYKPKPERTRLDLPTNRKSLRLRLASHPAILLSSHPNPWPYRNRSRSRVWVWVWVSSGTERDGTDREEYPCRCGYWLCSCSFVVVATAVAAAALVALSTARINEWGGNRHPHGHPHPHPPTDTHTAESHVWAGEALKEPPTPEPTREGVGGQENPKFQSQTPGTLPDYSGHSLVQSPSGLHSGADSPLPAPPRP